MKTQNLHDWNLSYSQARDVQTSLAGKVQFTPLARSPKVVAGIDCALSKDGQRILAAVVVLRLPDFELVETASAVREVTFPYIPGLLSFREAPVCIAAVEKLTRVPDLFIVDGQGIAHPRRLGIASHLGILCDLPAIGCAKSRLTGAHAMPERRRGSSEPLLEGGEQIGEVLRTQDDLRPLYVSVGHLCDLPTARRLVLACATRYRLPEPTRLADRLVAAAKARGAEGRARNPLTTA